MARVKIEHRLGVAAPAHEIWKLVGDLPGWKDWNPLYTEAEGTLAFGAPLKLTLVLPGRKPQVIRPIVESWTPDELIHWKLKMLGGLVRTGTPVLAAGKPRLRLAALAVHAHLAFADDALDMAEREAGKARLEEAVDAHAVLVRRDGDGLHLGGFQQGR